MCFQPGCKKLCVILGQANGLGPASCLPVARMGVKRESIEAGITRAGVGKMADAAGSQTPFPSISRRP